MKTFRINNNNNKTVQIQCTTRCTTLQSAIIDNAG